MSDEQKKPNEFEPVDNPKDKLSYLIEAARIHAKALVWTEERENTFHSHIVSFHQVENTLLAHQPKDFDLKKFMNDFMKKKKTDCFFNVSLPSANLFFKTQFTGSQGGLLFSTPEKIFKVQRRANIRFQIPEGHVLKIEFPDLLFLKMVQQKRVLDLSAGGLSFLTDEKDATLFQPGTLISNIEMTIRLKKIAFNAEVRHTRPIVVKYVTEKSIRVGVAFKNLSEPDIALLAEYVDDESAKYFARFL